MTYIFEWVSLTTARTGCWVIAAADDEATWDHLIAGLTRMNLLNAWYASDPSLCHLNRASQLICCLPSYCHGDLSIVTEMHPSDSRVEATVVGWNHLILLKQTGPLASVNERVDYSRVLLLTHIPLSDALWIRHSKVWIVFISTGVQVLRGVRTVMRTACSKITWCQSSALLLLDTDSAVAGVRIDLADICATVWFEKVLMRSNLIILMKLYSYKNI